MNVEIPAMRICSVCDEVVTDPHIHNVTRFCHPSQIEQCSTSGLDLEPANFAVIAYAAWVDMDMPRVYSGRIYHPKVGLS
jgi:hypothetical protein